MSIIWIHAASDGEFEVRSRVLLNRVRASEPVPFILAGRREDFLREDGGGFKLARRTVYINQAIIQAPNLSFFL